MVLAIYIARYIYFGAAFGQGVGPIVLDNLFCTGTEARLVDCFHNGINVHNCAHTEDAGVGCGGTYLGQHPICCGSESYGMM